MLEAQIVLADITSTTVDPTVTLTWSILGFLAYVVYVVALWLVFAKAGYPGILAIIPIVNVFILVKVAGYSAWLGLLYLIPVVNIVFAIIVAIRVGRGFGKGAAWSFFLLWLIPFIGFLILGLGKDTYTKPV